MAIIAAVRSSCIDVTKDLIIRTAYVKSNNTDFQTTTNIDMNGTTSTDNMTLPAILDNTNTSILTSLPSGLSVSALPGTTFNFAAMQAFQDTTSRFPLYGVEIIVGKQFEVFEPATGLPPTDCEPAATNDTWFCRGYGVASCSLSPCVRTYSESLISTSGNTERDSPSDVYITYLGILDTFCLSAGSHQSLSAAGYTINSDSRWLAYNSTFDPQNMTNVASFPEEMLVDGCLYAIDRIFVFDLWNTYLNEIFQGAAAAKADTLS